MSYFFKIAQKGRPPQNSLQIAGSSHEMGLSTEAKVRYNNTNRHNSHVARVPASSSGAVRYIFGASILTAFNTVCLYVKKRPFTKAQTQFTCCHTYVKLALFRSGYSFFSVFYFYYY